MSKMSQLHAELCEQAYEMGYLTLDQALADGCEVDYRVSKLTRPVDGREQAHEDYMKRKEKLLKELEKARDSLDIIEVTNPYECQVVSDAISACGEAIDFIKEGEV